TSLHATTVTSSGRSIELSHGGAEIFKKSSIRERLVASSKRASTVTSRSMSLYGLMPPSIAEPYKGMAFSVDAKWLSISSRACESCLEIPVCIDLLIMYNFVLGRLPCCVTSLLLHNIKHRPTPKGACCLDARGIDCTTKQSSQAMKTATAPLPPQRAVKV